MPLVVPFAVFFATLRRLAYLVFWMVVGLVVVTVVVVRWIGAVGQRATPAH